MRRIFCLLLFCSILHFCQGQKIGNEYLRVSVAFADSTEDESIIDSIWINQNHCLKLIIDTIRITCLRTDISIEKCDNNDKGTHIDNDTNVYFRGEKKSFSEGEEFMLPVDGKVEQLFEIKDLAELLNARIERISLSSYGGSVFDPTTSENECISYVQKTSLQLREKIKEEDLHDPYKYYRIFIETEIKTKTGKNVELNSLTLYL
jgi:hypothetical protein